MSDQALAARPGEWLEPYLKLTGGQLITAGTLASALEGMLGAHRGHFAAEVPESVTLPTGGRRPIDYEGTEPAVEARIQEVFGLAESPRVCGVPLAFRLLLRSKAPADHERSGELLAYDLRRGQEGNAGPLSEALLA